MVLIVIILCFLVIGLLIHAFICEKRIDDLNERFAITHDRDEYIRLYQGFFNLCDFLGITWFESNGEIKQYGTGYGRYQANIPNRFQDDIGKLYRDLYDFMKAAGYEVKEESTQPRQIVKVRTKK